MSSGGQRIESSLESGSRSEQENSGSSSSSPEVSSRSDTQSDRGESPLVELADRARSNGASPRGDATTELQIVPFEVDRRDGEASEHVEDEVDEGGEEEDGQGEEKDQSGEVRPRRKGSKRKGAIGNRLAHIPSQMTAQRLKEFRLRYGFRGELMAPGPEDRPWHAPVGWVTLYEAWFSLCHLWMPLPRLLTDYVHRRGIAFSQILPAGIRFMVAALLFRSEVGVDVDWRFFEEMTTVQKNNSIPGTYTIKARKDCSLVYPVNRTPSWEASFFFAKVDEALVVDTTRNFRNEWSHSIDRNVQLEAFPENFHVNIQKIRAVGIQHWPHIHRRRVEAAISRITNASWRRENSLRERAIAMAPVQVNAPSLAARLRASRSSGGNRSRESPAQPGRLTQVTAPRVSEVEARRDSGPAECRAQSAEPEVGAQEEGQLVAEGPDEAARRARKEAKKQKRREKKKKDEVETAQLAEEVNQPDVAESAAKDESRKRPSGEVVVDGDPEEPGKRSKVGPTGDGKAPEVDWSFKFDYPESGVPLVNNADKCAELFGLIKGSTSEVPAADDAVFKDMAGYAFKFIASCNRARGRYHRTLRAAATKLRNAQSAGKRAVEERDAAFARRKLAEEKWQVEKRRSEQLEEGVKTLTDKIEELKVENQDLISNLQTVNEAKLQAEKVVASEVARVKRHAEEKIESETTRIWVDAENKFSGRIDRLRTFIAEQEAIVKVKLELVQARGTLECLDLLKDKEMTEVELRADLEATMRDCELKLEGLRLSDLQEGDMPPQYPETPDGGSTHDEAEDQEHHEDEEDREGGNQPDE
ncbi:meiosis-specific protein ASY2-like [Eutrema salsugineum]|uniref:meiosis-specific protein ASY2-like n=1 Tax=Eutrema salsugineum TaxID=72664 RepID=UPI000CED6072|nr:meiosis-specific protein ASY2-like [Eutrema salsugineum]